MTDVVGRVGHTPVGELDADLAVAAICIAGAAVMLWCAGRRVEEVRREQLMLAGARESAQEQEASTRRELDSARTELTAVTEERDGLRRRLNTPESAE